MESSNVSISTDREVWNVFGYRIPKLEVVYFCQVTVLYLVILTCLVNLSIQNGRAELWGSLLSSSIGYLLPNPSLKRDKLILQKSTI